MAEELTSNVRDYILLSSKIESHRVTLFEAVQSLGEYINHDDPAIRAKATDYFSQVINRLAPKSLSVKHAQVVCTFLCSRMEDGGALAGISALQRQSSFNGEMAVMTLRAMVACAGDLRQRAQDQRFRAVQILHRLIASHRSSLKKLGAESATGILELVNGEKDPRVLMTIFSILEVVIAEWDIAALAEALFESVFCYFPITFRPPPNDPYGITAADLKGRLRDCIAASPLLAQHALPQLIDKLDSTSINVKRDVLQALHACISSYDPTTLSGYTVFLWDSLKFEVFNAQDDELAEEAIEALRSLAERLHSDRSHEQGGNAFYGFLRLLSKECLDRLREPQQKQAKSATRILSVLAATSPEAYAAVTSSAVAQLTKQYGEAGSLEEKVAVLEPASQIVRSTPSVLDGSLPANTDASTLALFRDDLFSLCIAGLSESRQESIALRVAALECVSTICDLGNILAPAEIKAAAHQFNDVIVRQEYHSESRLKEQAILGLRSISKSFPDLIVDETFPLLISRISIPDGSPSFESYCGTLECLAKISLGQRFCDTLVRRLLSRLLDAAQQDASVQNVQALLSTVNWVLASEAAEGSLRLSDYYPRLLELLALVTHAALGKRPLGPLNAAEAMGSLGRLTLTIFRGVDEDLQKKAAEHVYTIFEERPLLVSQPLVIDVPETRRQTIVLSTYFLAATTDEFVPSRSQDEWQTLLDTLVKLCLHECNLQIRQGLLQHITLVINKLLPDNMLDMALSTLVELSQESGEDALTQINAIQVVCALARALIWRSYEVESILSRLKELLKDPTLGSEAAHGFELLLAPDEIVCEANGARIQPFTRQRIFGSCFPDIATNIRRASATKPQHLLALSGMLKHVDVSMLFGETETILPPLLQILDLPFGDAKGAAMHVLTAMLQEDAATLEEHASSLVSRLLAIAVDGKANEANLRRSSLTLLGLLPSKMKETTTLPLRHSVTRRLLSALDDGKRQVRKAAVDCRAAWLSLAEADDES